MAASMEVLPHQVVHPPKREKAHGAEEVHQKNGLRPKPIFHSLELAGDSFQGFFPGDGLEFSAAPLPHPFQRGSQTVFGVEDFALGQAAGAGLESGARSKVCGDFMDRTL